jgi:dTDP-4-dehydrorhamnose 3,5-epimerase
VISGVVLRKLNPIADGRGYLMEILRADWDSFAGFGQAYLTACYPGIIKAWHAHREQTDHFCVMRGDAKVVLYDGREGSPTHGEINEFYIGERNPALLTIPPLVMHGFCALGGGDCVILNLPNRLYNYAQPDELRLPPDTPDIPYSWEPRSG